LRRKSEANIWNACYYAVQNLLPSRLLPKNAKKPQFYPLLNVELGLSCEGKDTNLGCLTNSMQRRITGHKRDKVTGGWRKRHNDKCQNLYSSPNITIIKLRMMSWTGHAVHGAMTLKGFYGNNMDGCELNSSGLRDRLF
jgi:hypothetical protein